MDIEITNSTYSESGIRYDATKIKQTNYQQTIISIIDECGLSEYYIWYEFKCDKYSHWYDIINSLYSFEFMEYIFNYLSNLYHMLIKIIGWKRVVYYTQIIFSILLIIKQNKMENFIISRLMCLLLKCLLFNTKIFRLYLEKHIINKEHLNLDQMHCMFLHKDCSIRFRS